MDRSRVPSLHILVLVHGTTPRASSCSQRMHSYRFLQVFIASLWVVLRCGEHQMQGFTKETCEDCQYVPQLTQRLGWRDVSVLLYGHEESGSLVSDMSQSSLRCLVYDVNTTDTTRTLLELHQMMFPEVNVVVVMKQVHVLQLMKKYSRVNC